MGFLYLASNPGFFSGIARIFDFGNTFDAYNVASSGDEADAIGLLWDWSLVGNDLWNAVRAYEQENVGLMSDIERDTVLR